MIKVFTRETCTARLVAAAKAMGLATDGQFIWAPDAPKERWAIDPTLLDRLAVIYEGDGNYVLNGGPLHARGLSAEEVLKRRAMTIEEYVELRAVNDEPRVRWITGSKETVTPSDWGSEVGK